MNALILLVLSTYHAPQIVPPSVVYGHYMPNREGAAGTATFMLRDSKGDWILPTGNGAMVEIPPFMPADTGMGKCDMDQFYVNSDDLCHRNSDGSAIHILPVPKEVL